MKLHILTENHAGGRLGAEHGISYWIEFNGKHILFDTGHTDLFLNNAKSMSIDILNQIDYLVLSHGHWDHGNGLKFLMKKHPELSVRGSENQNVKFISHPGVFQKRYRKGESEDLGITVNRGEVEGYFDAKFSISNQEILSGAHFLGEVPRLNSFEGKATPYVLEDGSMDLITDDSGIVFVEDGKLILISGCAHSGICNMMEHAKKITGLTHFKAVLGGFHLKSNNLQTQESITYLKSQKIDQIYPSHCTQLSALVAFAQEFEFPQLMTGMEVVC